MAKWFHWHIKRNLFLNNHKLGVKLHIHQLVNTEMMAYAHRWLYSILRASFLYMGQPVWSTNHTKQMAQDARDYSQLDLILMKFWKSWNNKVSKHPVFLEFPGYLKLGRTTGRPFGPIQMFSIYILKVTVVVRLCIIVKGWLNCMF